MLDHIVGKPSTNWKRIQVLLVLFLGCCIILRGKTRALPTFLQKLNDKTGRLSWRVALASWLFYYVLENIFLLLGLNAPDPMARSYKRSYYRATWILTALDAGFFTAMSLKPAWLKHTLSILFSGYYLVFAEAAEEKVRRIHSRISVEHMRTSWNKVEQNPYLDVFTRLLQPKMALRDIMYVDRPDYNAELPTMEVYRFYDGPLDTFADHDTIVLHIHGGGFVAMSPTCHSDALTAYAKQTGLPIISINYKKAPEYPFPWPIEECFDLYVAIVLSKGRVVGLSGERDIRIIIVGDSAGGNIATGVTLKIISHNQQSPTLQVPGAHHSQVSMCPLPQFIPNPCGLILIYPALDFEMSCWMSSEQLSLIRAESTSNLFRSSSLNKIWQSKDHLHHASPLSVMPDLEQKQSLWRRLLGLKPPTQPSIADLSHASSPDNSAWATNRIALTSRMCFFNDRIITLDLLRAMAILYIGPNASPDFEKDYYISPIQAPFDLLAHFPKTYMMCGEMDPLVDDTVLLAGRIRQARQMYRQKNPQDVDFPCGDNVSVKFLEGISHAFLQMMPFLPEARQAVKTVGDWMMELVERPVDSDLHLATIITDEKEMLRRRKAKLIKSLY